MQSDDREQAAEFFKVIGASAISYHISFSISYFSQLAINMSFDYDLSGGTSGRRSRSP